MSNYYRDRDRIVGLPAKVAVKLLPISLVSYLGSILLPIQVEPTQILVFNIFIGLILIILFIEKSTQARTINVIAKSKFPNLSDRIEIAIESLEMTELIELSKRLAHFGDVVELDSYLKHKS